MTDPLVGALLDERYRVQGRLARGGMASVYTAIDTRLDRLVAVKVMHPALADDAEFVARFHREAKAAARLSHPNAVSVFDQSTYLDSAGNGGVFLVMEYVPGCTLRDVLRRSGPLPAREALAILEPVLGALAAAHRAGLVHRDIKPENVLLADDGRVKVADFGLARAIESSNLTRTAGLLMGTVAYLAPEQVESGAATPRTDVYGAGILLYELLTGTPPYVGETPLAVAWQHVHADVPPPSAAASGIPPAVDALVAAATARDVAARPADASALLLAVQATRDLLGGPVDAAQLWTSSGKATIPHAQPDGSISAADSDTDTDTTLLPRPTSAAVQHTTVLPRQAGSPPGPPPSGPPPVSAGSPGRSGRGSRAARRPAGTGQPPSRWALGRIAGPALLVIVLSVLVGGWWLGFGRYSETPSLISKSPQQAAAILDEDGLRLRTVKPVTSETVPKGAVADTDPDPGERVLRGGVVAIALSAGPEMHAVPNVAGRPYASAVVALEADKLRPVRAPDEYATTVPRGAVIRTDPPAGRSLRIGTDVRVVVSKGPEPVAVPDVRGESLEDASETLTAAGLKLTTVEAYSDTVPRGDVITTSPPAGIGAHKGETVRLTVSRGPQLFVVPGVVDLPVAVAEARLQAAGFEVSVRTVPLGPGRVLAQSPSAGSRHPKGTTVMLSVF